MRSIIKFFNEVESSSLPSPKTFLYRFLNNDSQAKSRLTKFFALISGFDPDICATIFQQIAMCKHGSTLLFQAGATTVIVEAARKATLHRPKDYYMTETYGAVQFDPPNYFESHLLLLTTMLSSSDLSQDNRRRLMKETCHFLSWSFPIGDSLLRSFPRNIGITNTYLFLFSLVAPAISQDTSQSKKDHELITLEKRVIDLAYHIAAHPLPISVLPPLPKDLRFLEQQQQQLFSQFGEVDVSANHCWWDLLPVSDQDEVTLPYPFASLPPSSRFGISNTRQSPAIRMSIDSSTWTKEKYSYALTAMKSLENMLLFIKQRINSSPSDMNLNGIAISKGIYRCVEVCRNVQRYSESTTANNINTESTEPLKRIEHESLILLASILKRCSNIILVIMDTYLCSQISESNAMLKAVDLHASLKDMEKPNRLEASLDAFSKPISLILAHLKIETNGIDNNSNKEEMSELVSTIQNIKNQISKIEKS